MAVTIASTTSTQAQLDHAVSDDWRTSPPVEEAAASAPEGEGETAGVTETPEEAESKGPKKKGGFQKKIDRLVSRTTALEVDLEAERRSNAELRARLDGKSETRQPEQQVSATKPILANFKTVDEYVEALTDWKIAQKEQVSAQQAEAEDRREIASLYNRRVAEMRAEHDDFDEVVGQPLQVPEGVIHAIIEMDNGPAVAYYLGQNPEVCEELASMPWLSAVARVGKISAELSKGQETNSQETKTRPTPPKPVRAVGGTSARSSIPLDELSGAEYVRVRNQQVRERGRR